MHNSDESGQAAVPLTEQTKREIKDYLLKVVGKFVREALKSKSEKPFHSRLMPILGQARFSERSFSTRSGAWLQRVAHLVARQFHQDAQLNYLVRGQIQPAAEAHIRAIVEAMDHGQPRRVPNRQRDVAEVLTVQAPGGTNREVRSDLFILKHDGSELYFELKTPGPNKGQCKTMKQDILLISALRKGARADAFAAAAYNPFGDREPYTANYVAQFLEIGRDFVVGREFWSTIGDETTYDELLVVAEQVGTEIQPLIEKALEN